MKLCLFGSGGHAREVAQQILREMKKTVLFYVDDQYANDHCFPISEFIPSESKIMIAVGNSVDRESISKRLPLETEYWSFVSSNSFFSNDGSVRIGKGSFIGLNSILTTNIQIGDHAIINRGNQIGHDCMIGDFFSMMPGAIVGGNVEIGDRVYLGSGSNIREKIKICDDVTIGMNAAVVKDITEPGIYVGVPAKKLIK